MHRSIWKSKYCEIKYNWGNVCDEKQIDKKYLLRRKSRIRDLITEKNLLADLNHDFITNMHECFHDEDNCYIVMDYYRGGDLHYHL